MEKELVSKVLEGEIISPRAKKFVVTYHRYGQQCSEWCSSVEECIEYLWIGAEYGHLSHSDSVIKDKSGIIIRTEEEVKNLVNNYENSSEE